MTTASITMQPEQIERPLGEIPYLRIPDRNWVFRERAARLRGLAPAHPLKDFLLFVAAVGDAQQAALNVFPTVPLPDETHLRLCREHGMPPLSVQSWQRDLSWQDALWHITVLVRANANDVARDVLGRLQKMDSDTLDSYADSILAGKYEKMDLAIAPFVAAALQVYWTHMASALGEHAYGHSGIAGLCPVCASRPVASVVRSGGPQHGLRYVNCSLCETQWHLVRVKCSSCESTKGIAYYSLEDTSNPVKAEACDECGSYLKIMYMDKDPQVDPVADDLATLALDLLMDDSGKLRSGPNLFLMTSAETA